MEEKDMFAQCMHVTGAWNEACAHIQVIMWTQKCSVGDNINIYYENELNQMQP